MPSLFARVSPDGRRLAVEVSPAEGPEPGLWIYPTSGEGRPLRVSERSGLCCWSPDGRALLLSTAWRGEGTGTWRVAADGSGEERTTIPATEAILDRSPDGQWLVTFSRRALPESRIYLMHPDGGGERLLVPSANRLPGFGGRIGPLARFSPDGRKVLFVHTVLDEGPQTRQIKSAALMTFDVNGGPPRRFLVREGDKNYPHLACCWSPDGKMIAVVILEGRPSARRPVPCHLELVDERGHRVRQIDLQGASYCHVLDWRSDGR